MLPRKMHADTPLSTLAATSLSSTGKTRPQLTILLVGDDDEARALYSFMLSSLGHRVNAVSDGLEALAELQMRRPDLIITDIKMPNISGIQLIQIVKANPELTRLPIIAMTSFGCELLRLARENGASEAVDKPYEEEILSTVINKVIG